MSNADAAIDDDLAEKAHLGSTLMIFMRYLRRRTLLILFSNSLSSQFRRGLPRRRI